VPYPEAAVPPQTASTTDHVKLIKDEDLAGNVPLEKRHRDNSLPDTTSSETCGVSSSTASETATNPLNSAPEEVVSPHIVALQVRWTPKKTPMIRSIGQITVWVHQTKRSVMSMAHHLDLHRLLATIQSPPKLEITTTTMMIITTTMTFGDHSG